MIKNKLLGKISIDRDKTKMYHHIFRAIYLFLHIKWKRGKRQVKHNNSFIQGKIHNLKVNSLDLISTHRVLIIISIN